MKNVIIGVHGLSNKPDEKTLERWWKNAVLEGLKVNRNIETDSLSFQSVYWADVMYPHPDPNPDKYRKARKGELKRYQDGWQDSVRKHVLNIGGNAIDFFKKQLKIDTAATKVLEAKLPDLHRYYTKKSIREELRRRLTTAILDHADKRIMVVAHSMGSIIAYDVLRNLGKENPSLSISHFVTIGSPVGLPHVKYKIIEEHALIRTPSIVKRWSNLADKRDPGHLGTDHGFSVTKCKKEHGNRGLFLVTRHWPHWRAMPDRSCGGGHRPTPMPALRA